MPIQKINGKDVDISPNSELRGANLEGANLERAELFGAELEGANLTRAKLNGAELSGANLTEAKLLKANLQGALLVRANLEGALLVGANLEGANLKRANLEGAELDGANLTRANLTRANLSDATLMEANLSDANLSRADLRGADLDGANLSRANLTGANLTEAILEGANLTGSNLSGLNLTTTTLTGANLEGANLTGTQLPDMQIHAEPADVDALEIHRASANISINLLIQVLTPLVSQIIPLQPSEYADYIKQSITTIIVSSEIVDNESLHNKLTTLMTQRLQSLDYSQFPRDSLTVIQYILEFVKTQSNKFKEDYITLFLNDCLTAYNGNADDAISCSKGIIERFVTSLKDTCVMAISSPDSSPENINIYTNIISAIDSDPNKIIPEFIVKWLKERNVSKNAEYNKDKEPSQQIVLDIHGKSTNERKELLKQYLLTFFPVQQALINAKIDELGEDFTFEDDDFAYGGRKPKRTKRRKLIRRKSIRRKSIRRKSIRRKSIRRKSIKRKSIRR